MSVTDSDLTVLDQAFDHTETPKVKPENQSSDATDQLDILFNQTNTSPKNYSPNKLDSASLLDQVANTFPPFGLARKIQQFNESGVPAIIRGLKEKAVSAISSGSPAQTIPEAGGIRTSKTEGFSPEQIEQQAAQTGKVPYGKIAGRTAAETAASFVPETGGQIAATALAGPVTKAIAGGLVEAYPILGETLSNVFRKLGYESFDIPSPSVVSSIPLERVNQIKGGAKMLPAEESVMKGEPIASVSVKRPWYKALTSDEPVSTSREIIPYSIYKPGELENVLSRDAKFSEIGSVKAGGIEKEVSPTTQLDRIFEGKAEPKSLEKEAESITKPTEEIKPISVNEQTLPGTLKTVPLGPGKPEDAKQIFKNILDKHINGVAVDQFESTDFVKKTFLDKLKPLELDATTFLIQKGAVPNADVLAKYYGGDMKKAQAVINLVSQPTPEMQAAAKAFRLHDDANYDILNKLKGTGYWNDHVLQLWQDHPVMRSVKPTSFSTYNPSQNERRLQDYATGMNYGFTPKTLNIAEITSTSDNYAIRMKRTQELVENLKNSYEKNGVPLAMPEKTAFDAFQGIDHPLFRGTKFHPEIANAMNTLIAKPLSGKFVNALELANMLDKQLKLSLGSFHFATLAQMALGLGANPIKFISQLVEGIRAGGAIWREDPDTVKDMLQHGLRLGDISDFQVTRVNKALEASSQWLASKLGKTSAIPVEAMRAFKERWDKALWTNLNNTVMIDAYNRMSVDMLKRFPDLPPGVVKSQVADFINHATGHEVMEKVLKHPIMRQMASLFMLAPEFNVAMFKSFFDMFSGGLKLNLGQLNPKTTTFGSYTPKGAAARKSWAMAAFYYFAFANALNYERTKAVDGKGRFLWENEPDHKLTPFVYKSLDGKTNIYLNLGKPYLEVYRFAEPLISYLATGRESDVQRFVDFITAKMSALARTGVNQVFPSKYLKEQYSAEGLTGRAKQFATDIAEPFIFSKGEPSKATTPGEYAGEIAKSMLIPFSTTKGMTPFKLGEALKDALRMTDKEKQRERIEELKNAAQENGIPYESFAKHQPSFKKSLSFAQREIAAENYKQQKQEDIYGLKQAGSDLLKSLKKKFDQTRLTGLVPSAEAAEIPGKFVAPDSVYKQGLMAYSNGDLQKALNLMQKAINQGVESKKAKMAISKIKAEINAQ